MSQGNVQTRLLGMEPPKTNMTQEEMLRYYRQFDPIEKKYELYLEKILDEDKFQAAYRKCYKYESDRRVSELTKKEFGDVLANLKLIYADEKLTSDIIEIYDLVYDKVINQYVNIDGMERLFSESYINFEWEMHLGIDYAGHSMKFYRDHFIHQVRDAYCMDVLLENGFYDKVKKVLEEPGYSKISRYVCKYINQQMDYGSGLDWRWEEFNKDNSDESVKRTEREKQEENENIKKEFYFKNLIYMSSYMSALFHDIGYPEVANIQSGRNILNYIANVYNFGSGHIDFDRIITILQNSLLFRVVSPKEIRERVEGEKVDHGAVSALMFLLHFYENGAIHGLEPYKKCAVEIAGLAIYNHTNAYASILEGKDADKALYQRNVFALNPIAYLLRICDDLQEWDRIYFEISTHANQILCSKCHTPLIRRHMEDEQDVRYSCNCDKLNDTQKQKTDGPFITTFRRDNFYYRRIYNVTVCTRLEMIPASDQKPCIFKLNYDLERLLQVAYINPSYAKYRVKELNQLKKLFIGQDIIDKTHLKYFMSANIILIKSQIVREYLEGLEEHDDYQKWIVDLESLYEELETGTCDASNLHVKLRDYARKIYEHHMPKDRKSKVEDVKNYLKENFWIYIYFALAMTIGEHMNKFDDKNEKICKMLTVLWKQLVEEKDTLARKKYDEVKLLLKDCCEQIVRLYDDISGFDYYPSKYLAQFKSDKGMEDIFYKFAHSDNYQPVCLRAPEKKNQLDAYTDLYLIRLLLREIQKNRDMIKSRQK